MRIGHCQHQTPFQHYLLRHRTKEPKNTHHGQHKNNKLSWEPYSKRNSFGRGHTYDFTKVVLIHSPPVNMLPWNGGPPMPSNWFHFKKRMILLAMSSSIPSKIQQLRDTWHSPDILFTCTLYLLGIYAIYFDLKVPSSKLSYPTCGTGKLIFPTTLKRGHVWSKRHFCQMHSANLGFSSGCPTTWWWISHCFPRVFSPTPPKKKQWLPDIDCSGAASEAFAATWL